MQNPDAALASRVAKQRHFVQAMSKSIEGRPLTRSERSLLNSVFEALLRGDDVSHLTGVPRPRIRRSSDGIYVALHYLCLTRLMHTPVEQAWHAVGDAWGLKKRDLRWLIVRNHEPASTALPGFAAAPDRLLKICERQARGARSEPTPSQTAASTREPGESMELR